MDLPYKLWAEDAALSVTSIRPQSPEYRLKFLSIRH